MHLVVSCDREIISMLKNREQQAIKMILEKYGEQLYGFIFQQLHSEELVSNAMKRTCSEVWTTSLAYSKAPEHFFIWLLRIAKRITDDIRYSN